jgi:acyl-CoA reductase-like NAD-dependent aldehyde dehydrogenase
MEREAGMERYGNLIGGERVGASDGATFEDRNPARQDEVLGVFAASTREDVGDAVVAAEEAFAPWAGTPPPTRGGILLKAAQIIGQRLDEMALTLTREEGKTLAESKAEVARARDIFYYFAGECWRVGGDVLPNNLRGEMIFTRREPLGVVGIITPWNFPIAIPAWKIAPALAFGNTVVFKPASLSPCIGLALAQALLDAGLPKGVLNCVTGSGAVVGDELVSNHAVAGVSFTGSYEIGNNLRRLTLGDTKRIQCEMGGKNPLVVLKDCDIELAVKLTIKGGFGLTGQACTATSRVIVEDAAARDLVARLTDAADALVVGDGQDPRTEMGPVVSADQLATDLQYVRLGLDEGADLLAGGRLDPAGTLLLRPTVFDRVETTMRIAQEEIFGPVLAVIHAKDFEDAVQKANDVGYGLTAGVVTNDLGKALAFADMVDAGVIKVNEQTTGLALQAPFGGFKKSSTNTYKEQGKAAVEFYTRTKTVYVGYEPRWH